MRQRTKYNMQKLYVSSIVWTTFVHSLYIQDPVPI